MSANIYKRVIKSSDYQIKSIDHLIYKISVALMPYKCKMKFTSSVLKEKETAETSKHVIADQNGKEFI